MVNKKINKSFLIDLSFNNLLNLALNCNNKYIKLIQYSYISFKKVKKMH